MAGSFVAWVDYSAAEQERMREAIAMFEQKETRDELGIGAIRDALADLLFPGTSTIQTRLRYFIIVPWVYRELERRRGVTSATIQQTVRAREIALIEPLTKSEGGGVFGAQSGRTLQRLPSNVYWNGLRTWGIFRLPWSQDEYHQHWDALRDRNQNIVIADDSGIAPDLVRAWDTFPSPPSQDWGDAITLDVPRSEASYLQQRMETTHGSLLAHFAADVAAAEIDAEMPWDAADRLPVKLARLVEQARAFSGVMHGAAWLYNLVLCRSSKLAAHRERIAELEASLTEWAAAAAPVFESWQPGELWALLEERAVAVPAQRPDRRFVEDWFALVRRREPRALANDRDAAHLIVERERRVKGAKRARYDNPQALARWAGSGTAPFDYRWFRVRGLLRDLYAGLNRKPS